MDEIFDDKMLRHADGLRKTLARREGRLPKLTPDVNARLLSQMNQKDQAKPKAAVVRLRWRWSVAASVAILLLLATVWTPTVNVETHKQAVLKKTSLPNLKETPLLRTDVVTSKGNETLLLPIPVNEAGKVENSINEIEENEIEEKVEEENAVVKNIVAENVVESNSVELTTDQKRMTHYVAQLVKTCKGDSLPVDCGNIDRSMVYVFSDSKKLDVLGRLTVVVAWFDADNPSVRMAFSSNQMTLELEGDNKANSVNDIWLADKRDGLVYLYHAQSRQEKQSWSSASCYMDFLAENQPGRSGKMYSEDY